MDFLTSLKTTAQKIINLSGQLGDRAHSWSQEKPASSGEYTDRAGFVVFDDLELSADVYASADGTENVLRTRLAWAPKHETNQDTFTIITLDFSADVQKVRDLIAQSDSVTRASLTDLLNEPGTTPKLIHVSLESSTDANGSMSGKRYEYNAIESTALTEEEKSEFITTLFQAYDILEAKALI